MILREITPQLLQFILQNPVLSFDAETTGVNVRKDHIIGFSISNGIESFYVVHQSWDGTKLVEIASKQSCINAIRWLLSRKLIMHNGSFDCRITKQYFGIDLTEALYADTMLMAHTCNENRFNYGLKELGADVFGNNEKEAQTALKEHLKIRGAAPKEFYKADSEVMGTYAVQDALLTFKLWQYFEPLLTKDGLTSFFYDEEVMPLYVNVTIPMETFGINVDVPYLQQTQAEMHEVMEKLHDEIQADIAPFLGPFNEWFINYKYAFELNARFKQKLGEFIAPELWPKSEDGKLSFSVAAITKAKQHTKTEVKKGSNRPLLGNSQFEDIISGKIRCPKDLVTKTQLALIAEDGVTHPFNILSKDHLKRLLFGTSTTPSLLNEVPLSTTPTGLPQVDDDFLQYISHKHVWVPKLQRYNSLTKLKSTYVDNILETQENGIWYPQFFQHRTTSGRYSGNAQQLPRIKSEEDIADEVVRQFTNRIRNFFISGDGYKLVDSDYESLEVVIFADDAGDEKLLEIIRNKEDFYSRIAIEVYGLHEFSSDKKAPNFLKKHKPEVRQAAKAFALGARYGLGSYKLSKDLKITQQEAESIVNSYFRQFPGLKTRMDELQNSAIKHGFVRSRAGRLRRLPEIPKLINKWGNCISNSLELWKEYNEDGQQYAMAKQDARIYNNLINNSLNFPIQSFAASIVSRASIAISKEFKRRGLTAYICLSIHDEICIKCEEKDVDIVCEIMQYCMENTTKLSVPLVAEPNVGTKYGEVK